ncbi:galactose oxidase [Gigaspora margarita]|uniref:Galactose oxidase n=1 Tax=Gigaspora margarita TaxID=4874 RepID=A0A8H4ESZ2_GIGMA|nr:galactose oxidase [Gigaspora margarita]
MSITACISLRFSKLELKLLIAVLATHVLPPIKKTVELSIGLRPDVPKKYPTGITTSLCHGGAEILNELDQSRYQTSLDALKEVAPPKK